MFTQIARTFAAAALLVGLVTATTLADTPATTHYDTSLTQLYGSTAPYSGTLDLRVDSSGIVNGYYHPEGVTSFVQVTGGSDGTHIWFDIGRKGGLHVNATINDGVISGDAITYADATPQHSDSVTSEVPTDGPFKFKATPIENPGP
jgi:hypothetical protein